jgi:hypothetical protein
MLKGTEVAKKAKETKLWDRRTFLDKAESELIHLLNRLLREHSEQYKLDIQKLLPFSQCYVPVVPVTEHKIEFREWGFT